MALICPVRRDGRRAGLGAPGEIQQVSEAIAGLEGIQGIPLERDAGLAIDKEVEAVGALALGHDAGAGLDGLPAGDAQHFPQGDVAQNPRRSACRAAC